MSPADTAWMLMSSALVFDDRVRPGAFLWPIGRSNNVLGTIMQSFVILYIVSVL
jgi:ammonium transporter, Amt family